MFERSEGLLEAYLVTRCDTDGTLFSVIHLAVSVPESLEGDDRPICAVEHLDLGVVLHTDNGTEELVVR